MSEGETPLVPKGSAAQVDDDPLSHPSIVLTLNTYGHVLEQRQRQVAITEEPAGTVELHPGRQ